MPCQSNSVAAALKGYEVIVNELQETDQTIKGDFSRMSFDQYVKKINWD
jgi:hypothetical protein